MPDLLPKGVTPVASPGIGGKESGSGLGGP
jgi:hypothetical protein